MQNQGANIENHTSHAKPRKPSRKTTKERSTSNILEVKLEFVLVISRSLCLAMPFLVFELLFVLLGNGPLIMHGLIWGRQTHNRGYVNTYNYLCFTPHLCTFHQSICRSSSRSIHICVTERHRLYFFTGISQLPTELPNRWHEYYSHCCKITRPLWTQNKY